MKSPRLCLSLILRENMLWTWHWKCDSSCSRHVMLYVKWLFSFWNDLMFLECVFFSLKMKSNVCSVPWQMRLSSRGQARSRLSNLIDASRPRREIFGLWRNPHPRPSLLPVTTPNEKCAFFSFPSLFSEAPQRLIQPSNLVFDNPFTLARLSLCFSPVIDLWGSYILSWYWFRSVI